MKITTDVDKNIVVENYDFYAPSVGNNNLDENKRIYYFSMHDMVAASVIREKNMVEFYDIRATTDNELLINYNDTDEVRGRGENWNMAGEQTQSLYRDWIVERELLENKDD